LIDLDAFREINEALGREGGDAVLVQIAEHLKAGVPAEALFGRFEDDAFAVLMTCDDARAADTLAASLRGALRSDPRRPRVAAQRNRRPRAGA
jgi:diguanylate cyclase (GGDEF)-like protein